MRRHSKLRFEDEAPPADITTSGQFGPKSKRKLSRLREEAEQPRPSERLRPEGNPAPDPASTEAPPPAGADDLAGEGAEAPGGTPSAGATSGQSGPKSKKAQRQEQQTRKSKLRMERTDEKLEQAKEKLAAQPSPKKPGVGKKLGRAAGRGAHSYVHGKIHQVERENVGIEAAHKVELVGEAVGGAAVRYAKHRYRTRHSRRVQKLQKQQVKAAADYGYREAVQKNPGAATPRRASPEAYPAEGQSNPVSRYLQKQRLKRQYVKEARAAKATAQKSIGVVKRAAEATGRAAQAAWAFVKSNPKVLLLVAASLLMIMLIGGLLSMCSSVGAGVVGAVGGTSYTAEDEDILGADEDYTGLEQAMEQRIANIERTHPGYDEYRYSVDELGHNPYELAAYLIAKLHTYTRQNVQAELRAVFEAQYTLTLTEEVEVRYRTETDTWTDEEGNTHTDTYEVAYNYYILNVHLRNKTLPAVIETRLTTEKKEHYKVVLALKGNKPYLWEGIYTGGEAAPGSSYQIPGEALSDPAFAALIGEASKYIGYPYVWGGSSPSTSFDCSGFVCWVYTKSGVYNLPRTTATGIYNQCAVVSKSEARPGDLIFFTKTYDTPKPVSHVGIYVGNGMMLHCGNPIGYASIESNYWREHFYAFGRLP